MKLPSALEIRPDVMMGKPCIRGTRIPVYLVLQKLAAGETQEQLTKAYPQIAPEHVQACLMYAASLAGEEVVLSQA
jgi:uncharacterized protein (DUF433 family)